MPVERRRADRTLPHALALACLVAAPVAMPFGAWAQADGSQQGYSYKRPSPTTITTFDSLVSLCNAPQNGDDVADHAVCGGYFSGFIDLYLAETPLAARSICLPDPPITREQARGRFMAWAAANPSFGPQPAAVGVYRFLTASYPCVGAGATAQSANPPAPLAKP